MDPSWRRHLHDPLPPTPLPSYLQTIVDAAVTTIAPSLLGDSPPSSLLLIGAHASGKSLIAKHILHHLDHQATDNSKAVTKIALTGLLHSTPIRAWRHVASTLSSEPHSASTLQECLATIANIFSDYRVKRTPLVIVLDHFDRFITTADGMVQTVLYSLLNFLQDRQMRTACIAMTASIDVTDSLEKRVKSRFLHRQLIVPLPEQPEHVLDWISEVLLQRLPNKKSKPNNVSTVRKFLQHPRSVRAVRKSMLRTRVVAPILHAVDAALVGILHSSSKKKVHAKVEIGCDIFEDILSTRDPIAETLHNLTQLEISLLVALRKFITRVGKQDEKVAITFSDVFKLYESAAIEEGFSATKDADRLVERGVAEKSWERLVECGAVIRLGHGPREMRACLLGVAGEDVDRALQDHVVASSLWKNWGTKR